MGTGLSPIVLFTGFAHDRAGVQGCAVVCYLWSGKPGFLIRIYSNFLIITDLLANFYAKFQFLVYFSGVIKDHTLI